MPLDISNNSSYEVVLPRNLNLNLIKPLVLSSNVKELERTKGHANQYHANTISKIQPFTRQFYKTENEFLKKINCKRIKNKKEGESLQIKD